MNGEQRGFTRFINQLQMASFGTFNSQVVWFFGSLVLTLVDAWLLRQKAAPIPWDVVGDALRTANSVAIFTAHNNGAEQMRQVGVWLAGILVTGWTGKSVAGFFSGKNVRETSREYVEAKAKGEALATAEHPALPPLVEHAEKVEQHVVAPLPAAVTAGAEDRQWADGDPRAGVL